MTAWRRADWLVLAAALVVGALVRLVLLPTQGFRPDLDQFAGWVHHVAVDGLGHLYDENPAGPVTFGPIMGFVWAILAAVAPGFQTATDASDTGLRMLLKTPASVVDIGMALVVVYALRDRPKWAIVAGTAILLHPVAIDISAWWGQYESIYTITMVIAAVAAIRGHNGVAAAFVAVSLMTKPQAVPFLVPFAAWFWATGVAVDGWRGGVRELVRAGLSGLAVIVVLWLPFVAQSGPTNYLSNLRFYQDEVYRILSLHAWNPWWIVQAIAAPDRFIVDDVSIGGPITLRVIGLVITIVLEVLIAVAVLRNRRPRTLVLALAASTLVFFTFMTQMHERYAYAAVFVLLLLIPDRPIRLLALALGVVYTANLFWALPPTPAIGALLSQDGPIGIIGSVAMVAITLATLALMRQREPATALPPAGTS